MAASLSIQQRAYLAEFGRQWFRRALSVTDERESAAALFPVSSSSSEYAPVEDEMEYILDYIEAEKWEAHNAMSVSAEVDRELEEVADYIEASSWGQHSAMPAGLEVDSEMEEVLDYIDAAKKKMPYSSKTNEYAPVEDEMEYILDYIEAEKWEAHNAMSVSAEVDRELEEVADYIEASSWGPHSAMPAGLEVDSEMEEVLDYIDAAKLKKMRSASKLKGMTKPFEGNMRSRKY